MPCNRFSLNPAYILSHVALDSQHDMATFQYDMAHVFSPFFPQNTRFIAAPRRVGLPTRHRYLPIRRGSRFFALLPQNTRFIAAPRRVGPPTRHRYLPIRHHYLPIRRGSRFFALLPQIPHFLPEPRRVGPPSRHGCLPTRRGAPFYTKKPPALYGWLLIFFILAQMSNLV